VRNEKRYYYTPLSFGIHTDGIDPEARNRYDRALVAARKKIDAAFVLGGGWIGLAQKYGFASLAHAGETYLKEQGTWDGAIFVRVFQEGQSNSVDEIFALWIETALYKLKNPEKNPKVRPVTSWWHAPRIWLICLFIFHKQIWVHMSRSTLPWRTILRDFLRHECPGYATSCIQAWWKRRTAQKPATT